MAGFGDQFGMLPEYDSDSDEGMYPPMPLLHEAAESGNHEDLRRLLAQGADPNQNDDFHATPLMRACVARKTNEAPSRTTRKFYPDSPDPGGLSVRGG